MAVLNRDDYMSRIRGRLGDDLTDDDMAFMEDMTDTFDDHESRISGAGDWQARYTELRQKYIDRFTSASDSGVDFVENPSGADTNEETDDEYTGPMSYEELFKGGDD